MKLKALLLGCILAAAITMGAVPLLAQEHGHTEKEDSTPLAQSAENDVVKLNIELNPGVSVVGHPTKITGSVADKATGQPITNILVKINTHHIEDDKTMLHFEFVAADGSFSFDNHFFDGAEHRLTVTVESTDASSISFQPVSAEFPVEVTGIHPPTDVKIKTMIFLLGVLALGMVAGVFTAKFLKSRQSKKLIIATNSNT